MEGAGGRGSEATSTRVRTAKVMLMGTTAPHCKNRSIIKQKACVFTCQGDESTWVRVPQGDRQEMEFQTRLPSGISDLAANY